MAPPFHNVADVAASMRLRRPGDIIPQSQIHPPEPIQAVQPLQAPTRYLVVAGIPLLVPGATSPGERLEFSGGAGWIVGWKGTALDVVGPTAGPAQQAEMGVRLFINSGEELITNGQGVAFSRFSDIFAQTIQWSPLMRYMLATDVITTQVTNNSVANRLQGSLVFAFIRDGDYPGVG